MRKGNGLRRYFYEYVFWDAIRQVREQTGQVIPVSQAKAMRRRIDQRLAEQGSAVADPTLRVPSFLNALDITLTEAIPQATPLFGDHTMQDPNYQRLQTEFMQRVGLGQNPSPSPALPISPYDPDWSQRATIKRAGTQLSWVPDDTITRVADGVTERLSSPECGSMMLWTIDDKGKARESGRAMTDEDAAGLSALMDRMKPQEYQQVRQWVLDGGRDPRTGRIDRNRFMSPAALARSVAILDELQAQGLDYEVLPDQKLGQIRAHLVGTGMDIRLTESRENEDFAGARIYDNGVTIRYSTNHRIGGSRVATYSPTPEEAVDLLRYAQGRAIPRKDHPGLAVGQLGTTHIEMSRKRGKSSTIEVPDAYHLAKVSMAAVKDYRVPGEKPREGSKVLLRREATDRGLPAYFVDSDAAETYLHNAVSSARENFIAALNVDHLIEHRQQQHEAGVSDMEMDAPDFSADPEIAAVQRSYWDVLTGRSDMLLRPGATEDMLTARLGAIGELAADEQHSAADFGNLAYLGTPEDKIRAHAAEVVDELIGTVEPEERLTHTGEFARTRFDPIRVGKYMTAATGQWANLDDLASALRRCQVPPEEMMGTGFQTERFKNRLVRFDLGSSIDIDTHDSPFIRQVGQTVFDSLQRNAAEPTSIRIDDRGVIKWFAEKMKRDGSTMEVSGEIGQVFDTGEYGEIVTRFVGEDNALIVPGYEARIIADEPDNPLSVEERTRLRGYQQMMLERIEYQLGSDLLSGRSEVGEGASLNPVYSQLYGTKHPVDFLESARQADGQLDSWTETILRTEARRVRYSNEMRAGSTVYAEHKAKQAQTDPADDNHFDAWKLTGGRNLAVLTGKDQNGQPAPAGYFDPVMTGGAINQGIVRYLTEGSEVAADGSIIPGDPSTSTGLRAPLMNRTELETLRFDPFDRQQMTASTILQSAKVTEPANTAMMTFGGWTADDPLVVSQEFAEQHQIRGIDGKLRNLVVGDKISDLHGNKGVLSLIVDRSMDPEEALRQGIETEVAWFRENPQLDVVMSPFSLISRRNAGSARELMDGKTESLVGLHVFEGSGPAPAGRINGGLGQMRFVVTHMAVDEKTKIYDDEAVLAGKGRKASSQLAWALGAQECSAIMHEFYGFNTGAEANLREFMLSAGLDMEADGTLRVVGRENTDDRGLSQAPIDERPARRLFEMPELMRTQNGSLNISAMRRAFGDLIGDKGGDLELPFPLTYPTGEQTESVTAASWKMPVLSSHLRSGQEFTDGTVVTHDYTNRYLDIYEQACRYRAMQEKLNDGQLGQRDRQALVDDMSKAAGLAQRKFESITTDLQQRVFSGKKNIFKTGLMSSRLPDSATAVWTADPRLDIDQVAISPAMAQQLQLHEDDHALIWRDPVLRDSGLRYMRVTIDERLTGVAINPVMDACFDGDFDGDAVAVVKLHTQAARDEAMAKLSVPANLLDTGVIGPDGQHPLAMQISLDTQVAVSQNPQLAEELHSLQAEANVIAADARRGEESPAEIWERQVDVTNQLSDFYQQAQRSEFGAALSFDDLDRHIESVRAVCVETGAKGSEKKLADYQRYLGGADGQPGISQDDQEASMFATAIKAHGTGLGGAFSQRAVRALRNVDLKAVLEVTYPVTQSILQAKHDAAEARHKYEMLQGPGRELWRGRKMEHQGPGVWRTEIVDGKPVQATVEEWTEQFIDFYQAKDGFNVTVNPAYVMRVAEALRDPATGTIRDLEDDPQLGGVLMDRMAYGGTFDDLVTAADHRENLFDGRLNTQFASRPTALARTRVEHQVAQLGEPVAPSTTPAPALADPVIDDAVIKRDVMADEHDRARTRGAGKRSAAAVAVGVGYQPSIDIVTDQSEAEHEMGA